MMKSFLACLVLATAQLFAQSGGLVNGTRGFPQPNDGTTGTTVNTTAVVNSSGNAIAAGVTDTSDPTYIVVGGAGTTGNAVLASNGSLAPCKMDSTIASAAGGFYVINSTTVAKDCHAQSASPASGVWVIGFLHDGNTTAGSNSLVAVSGFVFGSAAGVSSFTGDGSFANNAGSTGAVTFSLAQAAAHKVWMNNTGVLALPGYQSLGVADLPTGIPNANLANPSLTLNTSAPLGGGGAVNLGGTLTLTCTTCITDFSAGVSAKVANYTLAAVDDGKLVTFSGASLTATLPATPPSATWSAVILNLASTNVTVSRNALQINGGASNPSLPQFQALRVWTDGTNYFTDTVPTAVSAPITLTATSAGISVGCATCGVTSSGLNQFAATTSAQLAGVLSDELGSGKVVFASSLQGSDANVLTAGTVSGTGVALCTDATGGATTSGCPGGSVPTGPTSPNGVPSVLISTPSGGVSGAATWSLSGVPANAQTTTSYTIAATDRESYVSFSNASAIAVTLPQAGTTSFANNFPLLSCDIGAGTATITPTTSTISFSNGTTYTSAASSMGLTTGQCAFIYSDNTNYFAIKLGGGTGTVTSIATIGPLSGGTITTTGTLSCPTCVTSAAALTNNAVVIGGGLQASSTISVDTITTHALFATAGAPAFRAMATGDLPTGIPNANLANSSTTVNGATCNLGSTCTPYGGVVTYTANHTITVPTDIGKLVVMNCSSACTLTFNGTPNAATWFGLESVGSTTATVSLNGLTYNGSASVPALNNFHALLVASDGTNYFGDIPFITGTNMTLTYASNGLTVASTGGGGGVSSFTGDGTLLSNSGSTGAVTDTLANAAAGTFLGNNTGSSAAPAYRTLSSVNAQTTTYTVTAADFASYTTIVIASGTFNVTLPISTSQPPAGQYIRVVNYGSGAVSVLRNGQNINGLTSAITLNNGNAGNPESAWVVSDGTNYFATHIPGIVQNARLANSSLAYNGQTVSLGSTGNVNAGATAHSVSVNEGAGAAIAGAGPGTSGQVLKSAGSGADPVYIDFPDAKMIPAANCNNATAGAGWGIGSGGTVTCRAGTNNKGGFVSITDTSTTFATFQIAIPEDWDSGTLPYIRFALASTDATNAHTIIPSIQVACYLGDGSTTDDVAANAAHSLSTVTLNGVANRFWSTSNVQMNSTDMTGCSAGSMMQVTVGRATDTATNAEFYSATITFPRLLAVQAN